jgi:hypothetical protein
MMRFFILLCFLLHAPLLLASNAWEKGYNEGYTQGYEDGYENHYRKSYKQGFAEGSSDSLGLTGPDPEYMDGYEQGYEYGYKEGSMVGTEIGYKDGYSKGFEVKRCHGHKMVECPEGFVCAVYNLCSFNITTPTGWCVKNSAPRLKCYSYYDSSYYERYR